MTRITAALRKAGWIGHDPGVAWEAEAWEEGGGAFDASAAAATSASLFPGVHEPDGQPAAREPGKPNVRGFAERQLVPDAGERRTGAARPFAADIAEWSNADGKRTINSRAEMSGLVKQVFAAPPAGAGARVVLFCAVDPEEPTDAMAFDVGLVVGEETASPVCVAHICGLTERIEPVRGHHGVTTLSMDADTAGRRLSDMSSQFAYVLLSGSQTAFSAPLLALASLADGTVLLVSEHRTRRKAARMAVDALQRSARLLGVVLTDRSYPIPPAIYRRL